MRASVLSDWLAQRLDRGNGSRSTGNCIGCCSRRSCRANCRRAARCRRRGCSPQNWASGAIPSRRCTSNWRWKAMCRRRRGAARSSPTARPTRSSSTTCPSRVEAAPAVLSTRGARLIAGAGVSKRQGGAFMPGVPDVSRFPARVWSRLHAKYWRRLRPDLLTYAPGGGLASLRHALADYLRTSRSVHCSPEQIVVTTGIHQSIDLAVRLLSDAGDMIWTEDPCYWGVRSVLQVSGLRPEGDCGRRGGHCANGRRSGRSAEADPRHAVAPISARDGDESRAAPDAARVRAAKPLLDHRGRL